MNAKNSFFPTNQIKIVHQETSAPFSTLSHSNCQFSMCGYQGRLENSSCHETPRRVNCNNAGVCIIQFDIINIYFLENFPLLFCILYRAKTWVHFSLNSVILETCFEEMRFCKTICKTWWTDSYMRSRRLTFFEDCYHKSPICLQGILIHRISKSEFRICYICNCEKA